MKIIDADKEQEVENLLLYLTVSEAREAIDTITMLLQSGRIDVLDTTLNNPKAYHEHVSSSDYNKEITIFIYKDEKNP